MGAQRTALTEEAGGLGAGSGRKGRGKAGERSSVLMYANGAVFAVLIEKDFFLRYGKFRAVRPHNQYQQLSG